MTVASHLTGDRVEVPAGKRAVHSDAGRPLRSIADVGAILGLQKSAVYELMAHGDLPFVAVTPRHRMVKASDLEDFIDTRRTGGWNRR